MMKLTSSSSTSLVVLFLALDGCRGLQQQQPQCSRRATFGLIAGGLAVATSTSSPAWAASAVQDSMNVDSFLRTGMDIGGNMGVSSQAGKSRPVTGVFLRDGSEISRDPRTGNVLAEILLQTEGGGRMAALTSYASPWPLATGAFFDVECRDGKTGDGAFLAVTTNVGKKSIGQLDDAFFLDNLLAPSGRFGFYGAPTDVKIKKKSATTKKGGNDDNSNYRVIDFSFSTLSQSTQTEIPRKAQLVATIPAGSTQAVMLVGSASASRWKTKGSDKDVYSTVESFRAIPAPQTSMKLRKKEQRGQSLSLEYE